MSAAPGALNAAAADQAHSVSDGRWWCAFASLSARSQLSLVALFDISCGVRGGEPARGQRRLGVRGTPWAVGSQRERGV